MNTKWKIVIVATVLIASFAAGLSVVNLLDLEIAQGNGQGQGQGHAYGNLKKVITQYDDPMRGMSGRITYRNVFQDALWYQINNPLVDEATRVECYTIVGMIHEGNVAELTEAQHTVLMDAVELMWGPAILSALEEDMAE
jgi:hypothetical protein